MRPIIITRAVIWFVQVLFLAVFFTLIFNSKVFVSWSSTLGATSSGQAARDFSTIWHDRVVAAPLRAPRQELAASWEALKLCRFQSIIKIDCYQGRRHYLLRGRIDD